MSTAKIRNIVQLPLPAGEIVIRPLSPEDVEPGSGFYLALEEMTDVGNVTSHMARKVYEEIDRSPSHHILVAAKPSHGVIGTATYFEGYLEDVAVRRRYQGNGVGKALVESIWKYAQANNNSRICLNCTPHKKIGGESSKTLKEFYTDHGYTYNRYVQVRADKKELPKGGAPARKVLFTRRNGKMMLRYEEHWLANVKQTFLHSCAAALYVYPTSWRKILDSVSEEDAKCILGAALHRGGGYKAVMDVRAKDKYSYAPFRPSGEIQMIRTF